MNQEGMTWRMFTSKIQSKIPRYNKNAMQALVQQGKKWRIIPDWNCTLQDKNRDGDIEFVDNRNHLRNKITSDWEHSLNHTEKIEFYIQDSIQDNLFLEYFKN